MIYSTKPFYYLFVHYRIRNPSNLFSKRNNSQLVSRLLIGRLNTRQLAVSHSPVLLVLRAAFRASGSGWWMAIWQPEIVSLNKLAGSQSISRPARERERSEQPILSLKNVLIIKFCLIIQFNILSCASRICMALRTSSTQIADSVQALRLFVVLLPLVVAYRC